MKALTFVGKIFYTIVFSIVNAVCYFMELYKAYDAKAHLDIGWKETMRIAKVVSENETVKLIGVW